MPVGFPRKPVVLYLAHPTRRSDIMLAQMNAPNPSAVCCTQCILRNNDDFQDNLMPYLRLFSVSKPVG